MQACSREGGGGSWRMGTTGVAGTGSPFGDLWVQLMKGIGCLMKGIAILEKTLRSHKLIPILCIFTIAYVCMRLKKVLIHY